jgi:hypothetical protein
MAADSALLWLGMQICGELSVVEEQSNRGASKRRDHPRGYVCPRTTVTPRLDGRMDEAIWGHAPWTEEFVDIEGELRPNPRYRTRVRMLWDDDCLYIGAEMEEPHVWGTLTDHDCVIYNDNDFEVFLDPNGVCQHYVELELNALNTTWDLMLTRPYRVGGRAISGWEFHGLRTAVSIDGTLNDPSDIDRGWKTEIAIPWSSLRDVTDRDLPPKSGDQWRINFSRVEWQHDVIDGAYRRVPGTPEDNWVWEPTGVIDMHRPERWGVLQFSDHMTDLPPLHPLEGWDERLTLIDLLEAQRAYRLKHGRFAFALTDLGFEHPSLSLEATSAQFRATLGSWTIDHEWRLERI